MENAAMAYVVAENVCPMGCGTIAVLVRCLPSGRFVGVCPACDVAIPVPLDADPMNGPFETDRSVYAPGGIELPHWTEVADAGLADAVVRHILAADARLDI